jgi:succinoglycan biosynthesis protein ExoM
MLSMGSHRLTTGPMRQLHSIKSVTQNMNPGNVHVCVCICTFRRPLLLKRLLEALEKQQTENAFTFSVVVVDNDAEQSAKQPINDFSRGSPLQITYCNEPHQNIALARNMALRKACGHFVAFIDDDEFPIDTWLLELHRTCLDFGADGVLGPVEPHFEAEPPNWILKVGLFHHPRYRTGYVLDWNETRSGNFLLNRALIDDERNLFDPAFSMHGEDKNFFQRLMRKGHKFVWCDEAVAFETQPTNRLTRKYHLRRGLLRGSIAYTHAPRKLPALLTSCTALCLYTLALPFLQISGHHNFMKYLIKNCDHAGKILAFLGYKIEGHLKSL